MRRTPMCLRKYYLPEKAVMSHSTRIAYVLILRVGRRADQGDCNYVTRIRDISLVAGGCGAFITVGRSLICRPF